MRPALEVADIFRRHGEAFRAVQGNRLSSEQRRVMAAIEVCRTAALGGHVEQCDNCGLVRIAYNSCRDRHCPKCQGLARAQWVADRRADLLPVPYFHVVFTVPAPIAALALQNKAVVYDLLLKSAADTVRVIGADPRYLGAESGMIAVLHTWGQTLTHHPHVHCVVPGGGLTADGRWVGCRPNFFLPVRVLSRLYRRLFLESLQAAFHGSKLEVFGDLAHLQEPAAFARYLTPLRDVEWVVYAKRPSAAGPRLSRPLHPSRRHRQQPSARLREWPRSLPLEGLSRQQQVQGDDARCRRVHPSLPAPHPAEGLPSHPSLRLSGKRLSCQQAGSHSHRSECSPTPTGARRRARRLSRALRHPHRASYRSVPGLRRPHGRDRSLAIATTPATTL
jgi:hypothetical protein